MNEVFLKRKLESCLERLDDYLHTGNMYESVRCILEGMDYARFGEANASNQEAAEYFSNTYSDLESRMLNLAKRLNGFLGHSAYTEYLK